MQVNSSADMAKVASGGANKRSIKFGISNNTDFLHILSNIYSRPLEATCREPICNAWDAHLAAGKKDVPIHITVTDDKFIIRDFGTGIDPDIIEEVYAVYGNSTKKDCVLSTGGFGLGCKAPFTYVDSFTVASYYNGTKTVYSLIKGDINHNGETTMNEIVAVPTTETGLEVIIPIVDGTSREILRLCTALCFTGSIKAVINGEEMAPIDFFELDNAGEYELVDALTERRYGVTHLEYVNVQYGNMTYPIKAPDGDANFLFAHFKWLKKSCEDNNYSIIIKADPDTLNIVPSREALNYTPFTLDQLNELLMTVTTDIRKVRFAQFAKLKAYWETKPILKANTRYYCNFRLFDVNEDSFRFHNSDVIFNSNKELIAECDYIKADFDRDSYYKRNNCFTVEELTLSELTDEKGIVGDEYRYIAMQIIDQYIDSFDGWNGKNKKVTSILRYLKKQARVCNTTHKEHRAKLNVMRAIFKLMVTNLKGIPPSNIYIFQNDQRRATRLLTVVKSFTNFDRWLSYLANQFPIEIVRTVADTGDMDSTTMFITAKNKDVKKQFEKALNGDRCIYSDMYWELPVAKPKPKTPKPSRRDIKKYPIKLMSVLDKDTRNGGRISVHYDWKNRIQQSDTTKVGEWYMLETDGTNDCGNRGYVGIKGMDFQLGCLPTKLLSSGVVAYTQQQVDYCKAQGMTHVSKLIYDLAETRLSDAKLNQRAQEAMQLHLVERDELFDLAEWNWKGLTPNFSRYLKDHISHFVYKVINIQNDDLALAQARLQKVIDEMGDKTAPTHDEYFDMYKAKLNALYVAKYNEWTKEHKKYLRVYNQNFVNIFDTLQGSGIFRRVDEKSETYKEEVLMLADFATKLANKRNKRQAELEALEKAKLKQEAEEKANDSNEES